MLSLENVAVYYEQFQAVRHVSLDVAEGEFVALVGSNGAGKTTTLRAVSGLIPVRSGRIRFHGDEITGAPSHRVCELGLCHVPEGRKLFPSMTVRENLLLGAYLPRAAARREESLQGVFRLFPRLKERQRQPAGTLSGGEQQMVAFGRALMAQPRMLMLDEPTLGLSPKAAAEILQTLKALNRDGMTVLVVSQEVLHVLQMAHRAYVMENGSTTLSGPARELLANDDVRRAFLGV